MDRPGLYLEIPREVQKKPKREEKLKIRKVEDREGFRESIHIGWLRINHTLAGTSGLDLGRMRDQPRCLVSATQNRTCSLHVVPAVTQRVVF